MCIAYAIVYTEIYSLYNLITATNILYTIQYPEIYPVHNFIHIQTYMLYTNPHTILAQLHVQTCFLYAILCTELYSIVLQVGAYSIYIYIYTYIHMHTYIP